MTSEKTREGVLFLILFLSLIILFDIILVQQEEGLDRITGHVTVTVNISNISYERCTYLMPANGSLFSSYCFGTQDSVVDFAHNVSMLHSIFSYKPGDAQDPWKSYNPNLPGWVAQDLVVLSRYEGYWIQMSGDQEYSHQGILKPENVIALIAGWNLIGYPSNDTVHVNSTFTSITGHYSQVVGYDSAQGDFLTHIPGRDNNSLNYTIPFQGYWINSTQAQTLIVYDS